MPAWSPLEHGCHVRDMCLLFHRRIDALLGTAPPAAPPPGGTELPPRYRDEDARQVSVELCWAAKALAGRLAALTADDWEREDPRLPDLRSTVDFLTRHFLHEVFHNLSEVSHGARDGEPVAVVRRGTGWKAAGGRG